MSDLTPIQTEYNGHHFRSRLEARWAVFFDALGIRYDYEAEGYELDGVWYLPDFWLPDIECFVEIKPRQEDPDLFVTEEAASLRTIAQKRVLVVFGNPWPDEYSVTLLFRSGVVWGPWQFAPGKAVPRDLWIWNINGGVFRLSRLIDQFDYPEHDGERLADAYRAARSARFEHGESGRTL